MKVLIIFLFLSVIAAFSPHTVNSQTQFQILIGGPADDEAKCIINTSDNGFAVAGLTRNIGAGNSDVYVIKFNESGVIEWTVTAGGTNNDIAHSIIQTRDNGYLIGAESRSFLSVATDIYLIRLSETGVVLWEKIISGFAAGDHSIDFLYSVVETSDNNFMVSATTSNFQGGFGGIQLFKLDYNGDIIWNKVYTNFARYMIHTSDGGYALTGIADNRMYALKLDNNGNFQWNTAVGGIPQDVARSIIQSSDGGYVMAGETLSYGSASGNMYIVKLDSLGNLQWTRYVGRNSGRSAATEIIQTYGGGYAVAGHSNSFGNQGRYNVYLVKLNSSGEFEWNRAVGINQQNEFGNSIIQTSDSGFIVAGYISTGFGTNMFIVKFDKDGNTCSNMISPQSANGTGGNATTPSQNLLFPGYIVETPNSFISSGGNVSSNCTVLGTENPHEGIPISFELNQNYPNPFNPSTVINYSLPVNSDVTLKVFDILGKEVATLVNGNQNAGNYSIEFNAERLTSGVYFYEIKTADFVDVKRMLLIK
jgi:hypothetical protein